MTEINPKIKDIKVMLVIKNVTVEETGVIAEALRKFRSEKQHG